MVAVEPTIEVLVCTFRRPHLCSTLESLAAQALPPGLSIGVIVADNDDTPSAKDAVEAMAEEGIDIHAEKPKVLTNEAVEASDVVVTMGCGDACPFYPGKRYEDWELEDPAGKGVESVRPIRDDIKRRILVLLDELGVEPVTA